MNIGEVTRTIAERDPNRIALTVDGVDCSYGELEALAARAARSLKRLGIGSGDRVALVDAASVLAVATMLGAARIGAAAALINIHLKPREIAQLLDAANCADVVVAGDPYRAAVSEAVTQRGRRGRVAVAAELLGEEAAGKEPPAENGDGEALLLFTSGTTGLPKPVAIGHSVVAQRLDYYVTPLDPESPQSVDMMSVPLFHIGGSLGLFVSLGSGNKMVMMPRFDAGQWLRLVEEHRVNQTFLVPTMLARILAHPEFDRTDLSAFTTLHYGAAPAPVDLVEEALGRFPPGVSFLNTFGQTETLGAYAALTPEDHWQRKHLGSAGQPFPGVEVKIVTPGTDNPVATGEIGEILVRAEQNVQSGWLRTGDLGSQNEEGYIFPAGRLSDTINRGGEKFGPIEIERVIRGLDGVRDVAVAGIPDKELGERVGAAIVADGSVDRDTVLVHCRENLARYKVPEYTVFVDDIPYTPMGKVSRKQLAELIIDKHR